MFLSRNIISYVIWIPKLSKVICWNFYRLNKKKVVLVIVKINFTQSKWKIAVKDEKMGIEIKCNINLEPRNLNYSVVMDKVIK